MRNSLIQKAIMPWDLLIGFGVVVFLIVAAQWGIAYLINSHVVVAANLTCMVRSVDGGTELSWWKKQTLPSMKILCLNEKAYTVEDPHLVVLYLQQPKRLLCTAHKDETADCHLQES